MKILEFLATRLVLLASFSVGLTIIAAMLAWHYFRHGELPKT